MDEKQLAISLAKQKKELNFIFKKTLPTSTIISGPLEKVRLKLIAFGRKDFADRQLSEAATHMLKKPGKLLRPALGFAGAIAMGQDPAEFVDLGVAGELMHIASLVHDDIIDKDTMRRGVPTVHAKYGQEAAILAGDAILAEAVILCIKFGAETTELMARAAIRMCAGELLDYEFQKNRLIPDLKTYLKIARLKSADEIASSCCAAAVYIKSKKAGKMEDLGRDLGIAFQIRDDIIETLDSNDRRNNGGAGESDAFKTSVVKVFGVRYGKSREDALEAAANLNNRFADQAENLAKSMGIDGELLKYIDFVRVKVE